ncbi:MAG: hypothetical protein J7M32_09405 [Deltaproteobacteria bacterium]|nr:hypothetical protein [Deltaproteobacteria bacterium]OQX63181.1 MAG: hypothetical protein B5M55_07370 [Desulfococcus sp. 4484_242]
MGEIRSTLDIIMEKAKKVEVTEEDKATFMRRELEGKARAFIQQYVDGFIDAQRLKEEIEALGPDRHVEAVSALRRESLKRLTPDGDNRPMLEILSRVVGADTAAIENRILTYREKLHANRAQREAALKDHFKSKGISGSAVIPNIKADPEWLSQLAEARERFGREIQVS